MPVTYSLGKDATITGVTGCIRSVTATVEADIVDVTCRSDAAGGERKFRSGLKDATIEIEMLDGAPDAGDVLTISVANAGLAGDFVVTSVARNEPLDDAITYSVSCKLKQID